MKAAKKLMAKKKGVRTPKGTKDKYAKPPVVKMPVMPGSFKHYMSYEEGGSVKKMKKGGKTKSRVNEAGNYTKPGLRKRIFNRIKAGGKGGAPGQWSARKAQMMASAYKKAGGGYKD